MKLLDQNIVRTPSLLGLGLFAGLSLYGYTQLVAPDLSVGFGLRGEARAVHTLFWNDRSQDLQVREIEMVLNERLPASERKNAKALSKHIFQTAKAYSFSPSLILAVIQAESTYNFNALSPVGAMGLMQIKPTTAQYIAKKWNIHSYRKAHDLYNPFVNITVGVAYLSYLRERFENPMHYIAAYNLGPGSVSKMLDENNFSLGKVAKYVTEIHAEAVNLRKNSISLVAQN